MYLLSISVYCADKFRISCCYSLLSNGKNKSLFNIVWLMLYTNWCVLWYFDRMYRIRERKRHHEWKMAAKSSGESTKRLQFTEHKNHVSSEMAFFWLWYFTEDLAFVRFGFCSVTIVSVRIKLRFFATLPFFNHITPQNIESMTSTVCYSFGLMNAWAPLQD